MIDPTPAEALDDARSDIISARIAAHDGNEDRRSYWACAAIDAAATILVDPTASARQVVAARSFLAEGLALDGRANTCGAETIDTDEEARALGDADQRWLDDYLANRPAAQSASYGARGHVDQSVAQGRAQLDDAATWGTHPAFYRPPAQLHPQLGHQPIQTRRHRPSC
ncbi:hypothetical protein [Mycobacterium riyadhense]|uniref:hypothetical protein n=1 Tax=Mycobacterium riyadhense TaxID=486698 RepID=UPI00195BA471|nr:hypothetical protein [Mycobacterium riyadhense]